MKPDFIPPASPNSNNSMTMSIKSDFISAASHSSAHSMTTPLKPDFIPAASHSPTPSMMTTPTKLELDTDMSSPFLFSKMPKLMIQRRESTCSTANASEWSSPRQSSYDLDIDTDVVTSVGRYFEGSKQFPSIGVLDVLASYYSGHYTERAQCYVTRDRSNVIYPTYELRCGVTDEILMIAKKMSIRMTSSFHFFDMTGMQSGKQLSRNSTNLVGKLKCTNSNGTEYVLKNQNSEIVAGITYTYQDVDDKPEEQSDSTKGSEISPRKLLVVLPSTKFEESKKKGEASAEQRMRGILKCPKLSRLNDVDAFVTKSPVLINGNFRLNFDGRVTMPSIKNFQLIPDDELDNIILQFGKVDDNSFNLDFKAPFNAFQAFALSLTQFLK